MLTKKQGGSVALIKNSVKYNKVGKTAGNILLYTMLVIFSALVIAPLVWVLLSSLKTQSDFANNGAWALPTTLYFKNYANAWIEASMGSYFLNSLLTTLLGLVILIAVSVPCAYVLSRYNFFGKSVLKALLLAGIFININYIVVPIFSMVYNAYSAIGIKEFALSLPNLSIIYAATSIAFSVYLMQGFFKSLSPSFEEAAKIDGCGYFKLLIKIIVPLAMPSILIVLLFNFLKFWNEFLLADIFLRGTEKSWTLSLGVMELMSVAKLADDKGRLFAGLTIVMLPTLAFYSLVQDQLTKGITIGGGKE